MKRMILLFLRSTRKMYQATQGPQRGSDNIIFRSIFAVLSPYLRIRSALIRANPKYATVRAFIFDVASIIGFGYSLQYLITRHSQKQWEQLCNAEVETSWKAGVVQDNILSIKSVTPSLWMTSAATGSNMLIYQIPSSKGGGVVLHNATYLTPELLSSIEKIGQPKAIIIPTLELLPRCVHFALKYPDSKLYTARNIMLEAEKYTLMFGKEKQWPKIYVAEDAALLNSYGVRVHQPSGMTPQPSYLTPFFYGFWGWGRQTLGGTLLPMYYNIPFYEMLPDNIYEFPFSSPSADDHATPPSNCVLASGSIFTDRDQSAILRSHVYVLNSVQIPTRILRQVRDDHVFLRFLSRLASLRPKAIIPAQGKLIEDNATEWLNRNIERIERLV